ncbi:hypothetical protein BH09PSE4_BH09PSE4_13350 [soil metagenome]
MTDLSAIEQAMAEAAAREDFEEAARLRNQLFVARAGGGSAESEDADFAGVRRQQPGAMGIGSQHPVPARPADWRPPKKPDPGTANRSRRRGARDASG